jgi:hypothetical protein
MKNGKWELLVDIPKNMKELLNGTETEQSEENLLGMMIGDICHSRAEYFHQKLIKITYQ